MTQIKEGTLLWEPSKKLKQNSQLYKYMDWLNLHKGLTFNNEQELWEWSVTEIESFWESLWEYFDIKHHTPYDTVLTERKMPGAKWFTGATLNYTEHIFRNITTERPAIIHASETREISEISWGRPLFNKH